MGDNSQMLRKDVGDVMTVSGSHNQQSQLSKNGPVYPGMQLEDLLYSPSTPAVTRSQFNGQSYREGMHDTVIVLYGVLNSFP